MAKAQIASIESEKAERSLFENLQKGLNFCQAIGDYEGLMKQILPIQAGEVFIVLEKCKSGWWVVIPADILDGPMGLVPSNYVELCDRPDDWLMHLSPPEYEDDLQKRRRRDELTRWKSYLQNSFDLALTLSLNANYIVKEQLSRRKLRDEIEELKRDGQARDAEQQAERLAKEQELLRRQNEFVSGVEDNLSKLMAERLQAEEFKKVAERERQEAERKKMLEMKRKLQEQEEEERKRQERIAEAKRIEEEDRRQRQIAALQQKTTTLAIDDDDDDDLPITKKPAAVAQVLPIQRAPPPPEDLHYVPPPPNPVADLAMQRQAEEREALAAAAVAASSKKKEKVDVSLPAAPVRVFPVGAVPRLGARPAAAAAAAPAPAPVKLAPPPSEDDLPLPPPDVELYRAKFAYVAKKDTQLSFNKDDHIIVVNKKTSGWWQGHLIDNAKRVGLIPSNYLEKI